MFVAGNGQTPKCVYQCFENRRIHVTAAIVTALFVAAGVGLWFAGGPGLAIGKILIAVGVPICALSLLIIAINHFKQEKTQVP